MTLKLISDAIANDQIVQGALSDLESGLKVRLAVTKSAIPYVSATVAKTRPIVLIAATERAAQDLANSLRDFVFLIQTGCGLFGEILECNWINQISISWFLSDAGGDMLSNANITERA